MQCSSILTLIGSEFTVSGFDRSHEVRGNYHWCEADITAVFPHQGPKGKPVWKTDLIDNRARRTYRKQYVSFSPQMSRVLNETLHN